MKSTISNAAAVATAVATSLGLFAFAAPVAFADMNSSAVSITTDNSGAIFNMTSASASTGGNHAGGSWAGDGGSGGDVTSDGSGNNGGAIGGDGGTGGNSSEGGYVSTGAANADAGSANALNSNDIAVGPTGTVNSSVIAVDLGNAGFIADITRARARTGGNDASGSHAGNGGGGGTVDGGSGTGNNGGALGGFGGNGGSSGIGGTVLTGVSTSASGSINVLNTNLVRVNH